MTSAAPPRSPSRAPEPEAELPHNDVYSLLRGIEQVLQAIERRLAEPAGERLPASPGGAPSGEALAYRFRQGVLSPVAHPDVYPLRDLLGVDASLDRLRANTLAFCTGAPSLDMLLYGERGTGKSSAIHGLLDEFSGRGLRLVETEPEDLADLGALFATLRDRPERFVVFCDDLSFDDGATEVRRLKAVLEGGVERRPDNVRIAVTSNRRHLLIELADENRAAVRTPAGELHPGETVHEKISLSDRFGLSLPFFGFDQDTYLSIVRLHAERIGLWGTVAEDELFAFSLRFALERGGRSGRTARHACIAKLQEQRGGRA